MLWFIAGFAAGCIVGALSLFCWGLMLLCRDKGGRNNFIA